MPLLALASCAMAVDPEEARVCRLALAGLYPEAAVDILDIRPAARAASATQSAAEGVAVHFRRAPAPSAAEPGVLVCLFDPARPSDAAAERLVAVDAGAGPLSPARLYMLRRFWLDRLVSGADDPAPVAGARSAPQVPRWLAIGLQSVLAGLPQMALLGLLAGAYALVYGLVGRVNLAFGELVVAGGWGALLGVVAVGGVHQVLPAILVAMALGIWAATLPAAAAGRWVFWRLSQGQGQGQAALVASAALALVVAETVRLARSRGPGGAPPLIDTPYAVARAGDYLVTVTPMALLVTALAAVAMLGLLVGLRVSGLGRWWRAMADDPLAAALMGLDPARVHAWTFAVSGLLAGLGGVISVLAYGSTAYASGLTVGLKALIAALLGGAGSIGGAMACGLGLGFLETVWGAVMPIEHRDAAVFALLVIVLVLRSSRSDARTAV